MQFGNHPGSLFRFHLKIHNITYCYGIGCSNTFGTEYTLYAAVKSLPFFGLYLIPAAG